MALVMLDFDGVMVTEQVCLDNLRDPVDRCHLFAPSAVYALNWLTDQTGALIVVSSTWRDGGNREWLTGLLARRGVTGKVLSRTPKSRPYPHSETRGEEIASFKHSRWKDGRYVILDDDDDMLPEQLPYFVQTEFGDGLTMKHAKRAAEILTAATISKALTYLTHTTKKHDAK